MRPVVTKKVAGISYRRRIGRACVWLSANPSSKVTATAGRDRLGLLRSSQARVKGIRSHSSLSQRMCRSKSFGEVELGKPPNGCTEW